MLPSASTIDGSVSTQRLVPMFDSQEPPVGNGFVPGPLKMLQWMVSRLTAQTTTMKLGRQKSANDVDVDVWSRTPPGRLAEYTESGIAMRKAISWLMTMSSMSSLYEL